MVPPFVDADWLAAHPDAVLADVRSYLDGRSERAAYDAGHLPGAVFVDLARWLAAPPTPQDGRHPLPDPAVFAEGLGRAGLSDDAVVVAYDDAGGVFAARLVWMLRVTGRQAALLDGGLLGWRGPLSQEEPAVLPVQVAPRPWPADRVVDLEQALVPGRVLLDARPAERFRGDVDPVDVRAGHVPGAVHLPAREHVDAQGRLLPDDVLRARLAQAGVVPGADVVSACGSGVTACHTLLVMEHLGLPPGRLWPGSWSQYAATDRPLALGG
ncbi:MAG: Rhodanese domain protein [Frankiales bacterium]|nr:Rhodanese domain protein [Frankiales bacterium]